MCQSLVCSSLIVSSSITQDWFQTEPYTTRYQISSAKGCCRVLCTDTDTPKKMTISITICIRTYMWKSVTLRKNQKDNSSWKIILTVDADRTMVLQQRSHEQGDIYGKPTEQILRAITRRMWKLWKEMFLLQRRVARRAIWTATASFKPSSVFM